MTHDDDDDDDDDDEAVIGDTVPYRCRTEFAKDDAARFCQEANQGERVGETLLTVRDSVCRKVNASLPI